MDDPVHAPTPRYWLVWPGTMLLLCGSFAEIGANYKTLWASLVQVLEPVIRKLRGKEMDYNEDDLIVEPCSPDELVPTWMWAGGKSCECSKDYEAY